MRGLATLHRYAWAVVTAVGRRVGVGALVIVALSVGAAACSSSPSNKSSGPGGSGASNGEAAKSAAQILADAQEATGAASSVRIAGSFKSGSDTVALDFVATPARSGGSFTDNGATLDLVTAGTNIYLKGSAASFTKLAGSSAAGQLLGDRWLQTTTSNADFGSFGQLFDLKQLVQQIKPQGAIRKGAITTVGGQGAIALIDTSDGGQLLVATTGPAYILEITNNSSAKGTIAFGQYGQASAPAVPTNAINLDQLEKTGGG